VATLIAEILFEQLLIYTAANRVEHSKQQVSSFQTIIDIAGERGAIFLMWYAWIYQ